MMASLEVIHVLKEQDHFAILAHVQPDGDAVGSALALSQALKKFGKDSVVLMKDIDKKYSFLPNFNEIRETLGDCKKYKTVIVVDCGDLGRLGEYEPIFMEAEQTVCIDHHVSHGDFAKYNYKNQYVSSTSELVYQLIRMLGLELDEVMANDLYTGIAYDTGGFRHSNVSAITLQVAADLVNAGAKVDQIMHDLFHQKTLSATRLLAAALQTLEMHAESKIASLYLTKEDLEIVQPKSGETDGIISSAKDIIGVEVALFLIQDEEKVKVSLRSQGKVDVSAFASRFGGGGHRKASGCKIQGSVLEVKSLLVEELAKLV